MAVPYNHKAIEKKWKEKWAENPVNPKVDENDSLHDIFQFFPAFQWCAPGKPASC